MTEVVDSASWEEWFCVLPPGMSDDFPGDKEHWLVHDAEMQFVCRAASEDNADAIAAALNRMHAVGASR